MTRLARACITLFAVAMLPAAASAQDQLLTRYVANIGPEDHYNSQGVRLTTFGALLAQDRANVHRLGIRHEYDGVDPVFGARAMRAQIAGAVQIPSYYAQYAANVVNSNGFGGTYMVVYVYGYGRTITRVTIDVPG